MGVCGTSSPTVAGAAGADAGTGAAGAGAGACARNRSTSRRTMRPPGPEPSRASIGTPFSRASLRARGLAKTRAPRGASAASAGAGPLDAGPLDADPLDPGACTASADGTSGSWAAPSASPRRAARSYSSPALAVSTAIGVPTATTLPGSTSRLARTPDSSACISTTAFSVSISASTSPTATSPPSSTTHVAIAASVEFAMTSGRRMMLATSTTEPFDDAADALDDLFRAGVRGTLEHLRDARRGLAAVHALDGLVEPVEEAPLDLVGEPPAGRGA